MGKKNFWILIAILAILALAAFFRFYLIKQMPGGLFPDEAANGLDVNNILKGHVQPFYGRGNGREGLFFLLEAMSVAIFGRGVWQLHIVAAAIGTLSVLAAYFFTVRLFDKKTALLAAFLMAVNSWHIVLSRTGFRAILVPLFTGFAFYFMARAIQAKTKKEEIWSAIFAGAFLAGGVYTYIAYRALAAVLILLAIILFIIDRRQNFQWWHKYKRALGIAAISGIIVFSPLAWYFAKHPGSFIGRASQVSVFNKDLNHGHLVATELQVIKKTVEGFFTHGDLNWRQNISGDPFLPPLVSPFFGIAMLVMLWLALKFIWQSFSGKQNNAHFKYLVLVAIFWIMAIPELATDEGIPHGLRLIGVIPAVFSITAAGLIYFCRAVLRLWHPKWMEYLYAAALALFLATLTIQAYSSYFVYAYNSPENFAAFRSDLTTVSTYLNEHPDKTRNYLVLDQFSVQTVDFLTTQTGNPYIEIDPANSYKLHLNKGDRIIFTASTLFDSIKFNQYHPHVKAIAIAHNQFGVDNASLLNADMLIEEETRNNPAPSYSQNSDGSFWIVNYGNRLDWSWKNQSFNHWDIKIWQCADPACREKTLVKDNGQNDYLSNTDYTYLDGTKSNLYFKAIAYNAAGKIIKNFGIIKANKY